MRRSHRHGEPTRKTNEDSGRPGRRGMTRKVGQADHLHADDSECVRPDGLRFKIRAMNPRWAGFRKDIWHWLLVAVGLMSGIAATFREWLSIFYPRAADG